MYASMYGEAMCSPIDVDELAVNVIGLTVMFADLRELLGPDVDAAIYFSRMQISIEDRLNPEVFPELYGRYRFTLTHELGHWVLHRQFVMSETKKGTGVFLQKSSVSRCTVTRPPTICSLKKSPAGRSPVARSN